MAERPTLDPGPYYLLAHLHLMMTSKNMKCNVCKKKPLHQTFLQTPSPWSLQLPSLTKVLSTKFITHRRSLRNGLRASSCPCIGNECLERLAGTGNHIERFHDFKRHMIIAVQACIRFWSWTGSKRSHWIYPMVGGLFDLSNSPIVIFLASEKPFNQAFGGLSRYFPPKSFRLLIFYLSPL